MTAAAVGEGDALMLAPKANLRPSPAHGQNALAPPLQIPTLGRVLPDDLVPADCDWPIVLGIDPGTRVAGYGALVVAPDGPRLVTCGVLRAPSSADVPARLSSMVAGLEQLVAALRPRTLAIETAFAHRNVRSALRIGEARGAMLATAARLGLEVAEYAPAVAKKAVIGNGAASKEQVASMVATILGTGEMALPRDATDALAVALAHVNRMRLLDATRRSGR